MSGIYGIPRAVVPGRTDGSPLRTKPFCQYYSASHQSNNRPTPLTCFGEEGWCSQQCQKNCYLILPVVTV